MGQGLLDLVDALIANEVSVVIIGGHAVSYHGYIRATEDIDLIFRRDADAEERLFTVLDDFGAYWIGDEVDPDTGLEITHPVSLDFIRQHHLLLLGTDVGYVDLFDFIPGLPNEPLDDLFASAERAENRPFASLAWLKRMKTASGRPQDLLDLQNLP